jgi:hypothetical protein
MDYWKDHIWDPQRDVCLRCARTAAHIVDRRLECKWA